jgi:hypothetical protein
MFEINWLRWCSNIFLIKKIDENKRINLGY